jgi:Immunoglobulin I-set domain.
MSVGQNSRAYPDTILVISCPVAGFPFPVVIWEKDGKAVTSGDIAVLKDNATTLAYRLNKIDDGGVFACVAANNAGTVRKESIVNLASK